MGLLSRIFKGSRQNIIEEYAEIIFTSEKNGSIVNKSLFLYGNKLKLNQDSIICFVAAELQFLFETNPNFKTFILNNEYSAYIQGLKKKDTFQQLHKFMHLYYKGEPSLDAALFNLTSACLGTFWGKTIQAQDPILNMVYSTYLSEIRGHLTSWFIEAMPKFTEKHNLVILNCKITGDDEYVRIWKSTFLFDKEINHRSNLIQASNISLYPEWTKINMGETLNFRLEFSPLPIECTKFDLIEDIHESGGFNVTDIIRNRFDIYEIEL